MTQPSSGIELPFLSLIIPAHNEEAKIRSTLETLLSWRATQPHVIEILIVENGSSDRTAACVRPFAENQPDVQLISLDDSGKGKAVRHGMLVARGRYRMMCDADLAMPPTDIPAFLPPGTQADIAIGSREAPDSKVECPLSRRLSGRIFNAIIRLVLLPGLRDTQCGFKCFTAEAAKAIFSQTQSNSFAFDVEVLYQARLADMTIAEIPIIWRHDPDSRVRLFRDSLSMLFEVFRIRHRLRKQKKKAV